MSDSKPFGSLVQTADGSYTLSHPGHGEEYHSKQGAKYESVELYMKQSGFAASLGRSEPLGVLDVGLGLGYNALTSIEFWANTEQAGDLELVSLEIDETLVEALRTGTAPWREGWDARWSPWAEALVKTEERRYEATIVHPGGKAKLLWRVWVGDALEAPLKELVTTRLNYVWQDAFSPKKNPTLWSDPWFTKISQCAAPGAILVTYSVARVVKDGLTHAGWRYELIPAGGSKRQWLKATFGP